jgi:hypothetical protein
VRIEISCADAGPTSAKSRVDRATAGFVIRHLAR